MKVLKFILVVLLIFVEIYFLQIPLSIFTPYTCFGITLLLAWIVFLFVKGDIETKGTASCLVFVIFLFVFVFLKVANSPVFRSTTFSSISKPNFVKSKDILVSDLKKVRKVNRDMAYVKCNKIIGKEFEGYPISTFYHVVKELGSVVKVKDELYWVFPLDYNGFFKWTKREYVPGYVMISATNPDDTPKFIQKRLVVTPNSYFGSNLSRFIYFKTLGEFDYHFEVDDNLNPYWIVSIYSWQIFFKVFRIDKVMLINATNCKFNIVTNDELESNYVWVDRTINENIANQYISYWSKYRKGIWYYWTVDVPVPTKYDKQELWLIETKKGLKWFTGMTSSNNKDNSLVYGALLDTRFKDYEKPNLYIIEDMNGVTDEKGAVRAVKSKIGSNALTWEVVLPQPIVINQNYCWTLSVISKNYYYQKTAFVDGKNVSRVWFLQSSSNDVEETNTKKNIIEQIQIKLNEIQNLLKQLERR